MPEPRVALLCDDEDIGEVGKARLVGDDAGEANLRAAAIHAEHNRMSDGATQSIERDPARPVRALGEKMVDQCDIETGGVSIDLIAPAADHAAGNNGLGHRGNPCSLALDDTAAAKTQRAGAAPAKSPGLLAHSSSKGEDRAQHSRREMAMEGPMSTRLFEVKT